MNPRIVITVFALAVCGLTGVFARAITCADPNLAMCGLCLIPIIIVAFFDFLDATL